MGVRIMDFVNLIDRKSDQGRLGRAFDAVLKAVLDVYAAPNATGSPPNMSFARCPTVVDCGLLWWEALVR